MNEADGKTGEWVNGGPDSASENTPANAPANIDLPPENGVVETTVPPAPGIIAEEVKPLDQPNEPAPGGPPAGTPQVTTPKTTRPIAVGDNVWVREPGHQFFNLNAEVKLIDDGVAMVRRDDVEVSAFVKDLEHAKPASAKGEE